MCFPRIRPTVLSNENGSYKWDGLISDHYYFALPQLGPSENWPYNRDCLISVGLALYFTCSKFTNIKEWSGAVRLSRDLFFTNELEMYVNDRHLLQRWRRRRLGGDRRQYVNPELPLLDDLENLISGSASFSVSLQGVPSGHGTLFVNFKLKVQPQ